MNKKFKNVTGICCAMAIVMSTSGFVLADTTQKGAKATNSIVQSNQKAKKMQLTDEQKADLLAKYKEKLATQVTNGKITQAEADKLYAAAEAGDFMSGFGRGPKDEKKEKPELTEEQKANLLAKYKERLATQVTEGKITQAEADKLYAAAEAGEFSNAFGHGPKGEKNEKPELTEEQKANLLAKYKERLTTQVTEGKITQAEADELYAAAEAGDFSKMRGHSPKGEFKGKTKNTTDKTATE
jgi:beta-N-acetylglucosaminidase